MIMKFAKVHQAAADALAALITKGMPPAEKRMLIQVRDLEDCCFEFNNNFFRESMVY